MIFRSPRGDPYVGGSDEGGGFPQEHFFRTRLETWTSELSLQLKLDLENAKLEDWRLET
jgi:hypothetical protein